MADLAGIGSIISGIGGIGIIRMSGKECFDILDKIFEPINKGEIKGYSIKYGTAKGNTEDTKCPKFA